MRKKLIGLFIVNISLSSCDTAFYSKGIVIDKATIDPIENALITIKGGDSIYTDSLGNYKIHKEMYGTATDFEIMIQKKGYKPQYFNFSQKSLKRDSMVIQLEPTSRECLSIVPQNSVRIMYYFNMFGISVFNIITLMFIVFNKKLMRRYLWIIGILIFNITLYFFYWDFSLTGFSLINGPIFLTHYWNYPFSVKIVVPIVSIGFWIIYIFYRDWIEKGELDFQDKKDHSRKQKDSISFLKDGILICTF